MGRFLRRKQGACKHHSRDDGNLNTERNVTSLQRASKGKDFMFMFYSCSLCADISLFPRRQRAPVISETLTEH